MAEDKKKIVGLTREKKKILGLHHQIDGKVFVFLRPNSWVETRQEKKKITAKMQEKNEKDNPQPSPSPAKQKKKKKLLLLLLFFFCLV